MNADGHGSAHRCSSACICGFRFGIRNSKWLASLWAVVALAGCTPMGKLPSLASDVPKPAANCCQAVLTWSNKVHYAPDTVNGGVPTPGLVGRLYLFGDRIDYPLVGDGSLIVDLYNDTSGTPAEQPLERWHIDADTMQRLLRRDTIGWGYTLFLPWSSCKPEITRVRLTARFDPRHGSPLFAPTSTVTLEHPGPAAAAGGTSPDAPRLLPPLGPPQSPVPPVRPSQAARR